MEQRLSKLLKLRDDLQSVDVAAIVKSFQLLHKNYLPIETQNYDRTGIDTGFESTFNSLSNTKQAIADMLKQVNKDIEALDIEYKAISKAENALRINADVRVNREDRDLLLHEETKEVVLGRLGTYTEWQYPGVEIGPGDGEWTRQLVALDPLYIVDIHEEFLNGTFKRFHPQYQNRLRKYKINHGDLSALPERQFGLVFAWNVFNYFDIDTIEQYLIEIKRLLLPGGVVFFSYNNCDTYKSCEMFEGHYMSYTTNKDVAQLAKRLGFEIIKSMEQPTLVSWMEIKTPGELISNRAGQTVAKINEQIEPHRILNGLTQEERQQIIADLLDLKVDTKENLNKMYTGSDLMELNKVYNDRVRTKIINKSLELVIDTEDKLVGAYTLKKLVELIKIKDPKWTIDG